ncbi:MAG: DUF1795 domain-containing protein [Desulfarculaceae bacterium]|nr:DUF1795 domain-containing protein [Desulfarculaceae bacterium]MCF8072452.1 DUF1795 domain-containing protein [Desulfarculaceae bacterium]MCF8102913.1 DUF1795 domain-containing protein [Desulfarculaceae bacterium]MCF8117484.1 DUF1795 domain-containing protein [Desulfarculaceae bacterium]
MKLCLPAPALVLAILLALPMAALAAQPGYRGLSLSRLGCRLELPAKWVSEKKANALVFSGAKGTPEFRTTITLQVVDQNTYPNLDAVAADYLGQWSRNPGYKLLTRKTGKLDGRPGIMIAARYQHRGRAFHQEQVIIQRRPYYYLLGYTAPEDIFHQGMKHMARALASFRFIPLSAGAGAPAWPAAPDPAQARRQDQMTVAAYGPTLLKQLQGPLYSHTFENGTPQGHEVATAHNRIITALAKTLAAQAVAQKPALAWLDKLGQLQIKQMALLEGAKAQAPAAAPWWDKAKALFKLQMDYDVVRSAQRGAVEGALIGQAKPSEASLSLAGVQMLAKLQLAVSDQLALLLKENDQLWSPSLKLWEAISADPALPAAFRLELAQLNQEQRELALGLIRATIKANGAMTATVLVIGNLEAFYGEVSRAYGKAIASALPGLKEQARRMAAANPDDPAVDAVKMILNNLDHTAAQVELAVGPEPQPSLGQRLADALVPPAHAGGLLNFNNFTSRFASNVGYSVLLAGKAVQNAGRFVVSGVDTSSQRAAQMLAYGTYSPFRVTSDPKAILATADEIIKKNPEMAKHRPELVKQLKGIATRHKTENVQDYNTLKKQTIDAAVSEYAKGEHGVRALQTGVKWIEEVGEKKVKPAAAWVAGKLSTETLGPTIGGVVSPVAKGVTTFLAGTGYNVVMDLAKNPMILMNPKTSYSEKAVATLSLASNVGVSVMCYKGTAMAVVGKVAPKLGAAGKGLVAMGGKMVGRLLPKSAQAAGQAAVQMVKPAAVAAGKQVAREVAVLRPLESQAATYVVNGIKLGVSKIKDMAVQPVLATMGAETKGMITSAWTTLSKDMVNTSGTAALKAFAGNFGFKALLEGGANDTFSSKVLQPTLQTTEDHLNKPAATKKSGGFNAKGAAPDQKAEKAAEAKKAEVKKAEVKKKPPAKKKVKRRKETPEERKARKKALMEKAKRLAARDESVYGKQGTEGTKVIPSTCTIDMITWIQGHEKDKWPSTFYIRGGQVSGSFSYTYDYSKHCTDKFCCSSPRTTGVFSGSLINNVISGTWNMKHHTQQCWHIWTESIKGGDGKYTSHQRRCNYSTTSNTNYRIEAKLGMSGRVELTWSGTSHGSTTWGPTCYKNIAGTTRTYDNSFSWDDPNYPAEYRNKLTIGVWEIRKRPAAEEKQEQ